MTVTYENKDRLNSIHHILSNIDRLKLGDQTITGKEIVSFLKSEADCLQNKCSKHYETILISVGQLEDPPKTDSSDISKGLSIPVMFNLFDLGQLAKAEGIESMSLGTTYNSLVKDFLYFSSQIVKIHKLAKSIDQSRDYNFSKSIIDKLGL